ncbi:single-stranded DNA-binding protein [uncultured Thiohalocapsa sp.]|uniref:single-stranded DNA-binding protein n=1 Tax=uncultured Thiohalocapsa sp. TaxID=768990 RepID=UPI0025FA3DDF|nr:single-stranded DNA-binding protein [uncultured Thiohalocapsa sp.]
MMQASIHGRLGKDPQPINTRTGKPMTAASVAVDVSQRDQESTLWVRVIAFGKLADQLAKHAKGETLSASGRLELSKWTAEDGTARESWQLIADALVSARTVRPGSARSNRQGTTGPPKPSNSDAAPFDDPVPPF